MYLYEVHHDDFGRGDPCEIGKWIVVNHLGTLISNEPIKLVPEQGRNNAFLDIDPENDWDYEGIDSTLKEYMEEHPPQKAKPREHER